MVIFPSKTKKNKKMPGALIKLAKKILDLQRILENLSKVGRRKRIFRYQRGESSTKKKICKI